MSLLKFFKIRTAQLSLLAVLLLTFVGLSPLGQMAGVILAEEEWTQEDMDTYCATNDCSGWESTSEEEWTEEWTEEDTEWDTTEWTEEEWATYCETNDCEGWEETSEDDGEDWSETSEEWEEYCEVNDCDQWSDGEWSEEDYEDYYDEGVWEDKPYEDYYYGEEGYYYGEDGYYDETGTFHAYEDEYGDYEDFYYDAADEEHFVRQQEGMKEELASLREELSSIKDILSKLEDASTPNSRVSAALTELLGLAGKAGSVLEQMEGALEEGLSDEDTMDSFWDTMDSLGDAAETHMEVIEEWLEEDSSAAAALTDEELAFLTMDHEGEEYSEDDIASYLEGQYADLADDFDLRGFAGEVSAEEMDKIFRHINDAMMQELLKYMDDEHANEILTNMMNMLPVFGDKGTTLMQNTTEVLDVLGEIDSEVLASSDELEALYEETKGSLVTDDSKEELKEVWANVEEALAAGDVSEATMNTYVEEVKQLLEENQESLVLDEQVEFYDATLEENAWYFDDLADARDADILSGDKDAEGNPTGYVRPGDEVTKAEALKMILEGAGLDGSSGSAADSSVEGQWFEEYVKQAEELGLPYQGDWNESCDRGTVAAWTAEVFVGDVAGIEIADFEYEGTFEDVSESDPNVEYYQAVYEYGIFTGDDATGDLRPDDPINRAETTKVVMTAVEEVVETAEAAEKLDDVGTLLERKAARSAIQGQ